jgi:transcriptional regulator GlxA family with amidase domain
LAEIEGNMSLLPKFFVVILLAANAHNVFMNKTKHIVIIAPPLTAILDVAGPLEVFAKAADYIDNYIQKTAGTSYAMHVVSTQSAKIVNTSSGLPIVCEGSIKSINYEVDTILVAGIPNAPENMVNKETLN